MLRMIGSSAKWLSAAGPVAAARRSLCDVNVILRPCAKRHESCTGLVRSGNNREHRNARRGLVRTSGQMQSLASPVRPHALPAPTSRG